MTDAKSDTNDANSGQKHDRCHEAQGLWQAEPLQKGTKSENERLIMIMIIRFEHVRIRIKDSARVIRAVSRAGGEHG